MKYLDLSELILGGRQLPLDSGNGSTHVCLRGFHGFQSLGQRRTNEHHTISQRNHKKGGEHTNQHFDSTHVQHTGECSTR